MALADAPLGTYLNRKMLGQAMANPGSTTMAPGPVEYKRKYALWVLVLLVIVCWPAAIVYYFTREKVPVLEYHAVQAAPPGWGAPPAAPLSTTPPAGSRYCPRCGAANGVSAGFCGKCGAQMQ